MGKKDDHKLNREINDLRKYIRHINETKYADLLALEYHVLYWENKYSLSEDGDTSYSRNVEISSHDGDVKYYPITMTLLEGEKVEDIDELEITAMNPKTGKDLNWFVIDFRPNKISFVVVLDPPARESQNGNIEISMNWKGLFKPLIENNFDRCILNINSFTENIRIIYVAPRGYQWEKFIMSPDNIGELQEFDTEGERSRLEFNASNVDLGRYTYELYWKKTTP